MPPLPTGTVTFLFTDIEGSTKLWQQDPDAMKIALTRHHALLQHAIEANGGYVFQIVGDGFYAAFQTASDAVAAALAAQCAIVGERWNDVGSIRVRMALHTGPVDVREGEYTSGEYASGLTLSRTARLLSAAHGGQILVSQRTQELVGDQLPPQAELRYLGTRRLRDLRQPERLFQLASPELPSSFPALRSLDVIPNNLPVQLTSFIGRAREMTELKRLLTQTRLLTVTGTGGSGKTRLALEVVGHLLSDFDDGVWLIELAGFVDPALLTHVVAVVLNVREEPGRTLVQAMVDSLRGKRVLLVFDNCDHLIPACAALIDCLLRSLPNLTVLATSREALGMSGETVWLAPPLSLPDPDRRLSAAQRVTCDAIRLFIDRATAVFPRFTLTEQNAVAVATVCRRLDGIPLAIELAAARLTSLSAEQIAGRLDDRFRLLTRGNRTVSRHQTLRTAIDSSYDLLSDRERALFRRLTVFAGGFTLDGAKAVCSDGALSAGEIVDLLTLLVDKSILSMDRGVNVRYRLLETLREYGAEKLRESGEETVWCARRRDWLLELMSRAEPELQGPRQRVWLEDIEAEHDNLRATLEWNNTEDDREPGLRLAAASWRFWQLRGYLSEGRAWLEGALRHAGNTPPSERIKALMGTGNLAYMQGDYARSEELYKESLALSRRLGDTRHIASALNNLGLICQNRGDYTVAAALCEESLVLRRKTGDPRDIADSLNNLVGVAWALGDGERAVALCEESLALWRELGDSQGVAGALNNLGLVARHHGDYAGARILYEESLAIRRELGDRISIADSLANLGYVAQCLEDYGQARGLYEESLALYRDVGANLSIAQCLERLASVACAQQQHERAARLFGAADALRATIGAPLGTPERTEIDRDIASVRAELGEKAATRALEAGHMMTQEAALTYAIGDRD